MAIRMRNGEIPITVNSIHQQLSLPIGGLDLNSLAPSKGDDDLVGPWRKQYKKDRMKPKDVLNVIIESAESGENFKLNFLVMMVNTLAECSREGFAI